MAKDEAELVPINSQPGYGGTEAEESKKPDIDISDFKPAAPTWVLDGTLRAKEQKKFKALIESASSKAPGKMAGCLNAFKPCLAGAAVCCEVCLPIYGQIAYYIAKFCASLPTDVFGVVWGLCLVFFGGFYPLTMAAFEAARQCGGSDTYEALHDIAVQLSKYKKMSAKDDLIDADHNGVADVEEITGVQLAKRKHGVLLKATDPQVLDKAFKGVYTAWIAVLAVLKIQFAQMIALGTAIGGFAAQLLRVPATQVMVHVMDKDSHKWIPTYISYTCKGIAVIIAYHVQKIITAFYSATRGGLMVFRCLFAILDRCGVVHVDPNETYLDEVFGWTLAAVGFYFQYGAASQNMTPPRHRRDSIPTQVHPNVRAAVLRRAPALAAPNHRVRPPLRGRVHERAGRRLDVRRVVFSPSCP